VRHDDPRCDLQQQYSRDSEEVLSGFALARRERQEPNQRRILRPVDISSRFSERSDWRSVPPQGQTFDRFCEGVPIQFWCGNAAGLICASRRSGDYCR